MLEKGKRQKAYGLVNAGLGVVLAFCRPAFTIEKEKRKRRAWEGTPLGGRPFSF